jgi:DNA-binding transcriptional regulator YdaS (Cro superfamily)
MDLGQAAMAESIGMSLRGYQALESGETAIRPLHILAMERAAEKVAVATKNPMIAPPTVRRDAQELAKMLISNQVTSTSSKFKLVEVELDAKGNVVKRNVVSGPPFSTRAEAEAMAQRAAESVWVSGYNEEHGYWWARDLRDTNYRFYVEPY